MVPIEEHKPGNFSLKGFIQVTRLPNLLIIVLAQYFTALFLVGGGQDFERYLFDFRLLILSLSSVIIAAAGYIINDYYDVKIDLINKPERVVVGRILKRRVAMVAHTILNFTGIGMGLLLSWKIALINFLCAVLLWLYSNQLKRIVFIGNLVVAGLTGLSIYIVDLYYGTNNIMVIAYAVFAFSFTLIREIIKDMEDLKGDASFGRKTIPVVYGIRQTKVIIYIFSILFITIISLLAYLFVGSKMTIFTLLMIIPLGYLMLRLVSADTIKNYSRLSNYCKVVMLAGILSMYFF